MKIFYFLFCLKKYFIIVFISACLLSCFCLFSLIPNYDFTYNFNAPSDKICNVPNVIERNLFFTYIFFFRALPFCFAFIL